MSLHEQCVGKTDEWYTPPHVFKALGCDFDMDVASPGAAVTHWIPTKRFITANSLQMAWSGFCWMNSPFGGRNGLVPWLEKFFAHGNGIALVPDRTSAPWWQQYAPRADLALFVAPKLKFIGVDGKPGDSPAQGTCLLAAGAQAVEALKRAAANGLGSPFAPIPGRDLVDRLGDFDGCGNTATERFQMRMEALVEIKKLRDRNEWLESELAKHNRLERQQKNEREMAEGTRCSGLCKDGGACNC